MFFAGVHSQQNRRSGTAVSTGQDSLYLCHVARFLSSVSLCLPVPKIGCNSACLVGSLEAFTCIKCLAQNLALLSCLTNTTSSNQQALNEFLLRPTPGCWVLWGVSKKVGCCSFLKDGKARERQQNDSPGQLGWEGGGLL